MSETITMGDVLRKHRMVTASSNGDGRVYVDCECGHTTVGTEVENHEHADDATIHALHQSRQLYDAGFEDRREAGAEALNDAADWLLGGRDEDDTEDGSIGLWLRGRASGLLRGKP